MQKVKSRFTLKTAREMKRYTQEEAAKRIGVSVDTLGNYERGKSYPDIPVLRKIEEVYGIPYEQLIFLPLDYDKTVNLIWHFCYMTKDLKNVMLRIPMAVKDFG